MGPTGAAARGLSIAGEGTAVNEVLVRPDVPVLRLVGDLVGAGGAGVRSALATMAGEPDLIVDLTDVGGVDDDSLDAVANAIRGVRSGGGQVVIVAPRAAVTDALAAAGLEDLAPVAASIPEARSLIG